MEKTQLPTTSEKTCQGCRYFDTIVNALAGQSLSVCRFKAPGQQGQCIGIDQHTNQPKWLYTTLWPIVQPTDWCGDWQRKLQS